MKRKTRLSQLEAQRANIRRYELRKAEYEQERLELQVILAALEARLRPGDRQGEAEVRKIKARLKQLSEEIQTQSLAIRVNRGELGRRATRAFDMQGDLL